MCSEETLEELQDQIVEMRIEISRAMGLPPKLCSNVYIQYKFFMDADESRSLAFEGVSMNPTIDYKRTIIIDPVTEDFIDYMQNGLVEVQVFGEIPKEETKTLGNKKAFVLSTMKGGDEIEGAQVQLAVQERKELEAIRSVLQSRTPSPSPSPTAAHSRAPSAVKQVQELVEENKKLQEEVPASLSARVAC